MTAISASASVPAPTATTSLQAAEVRAAIQEADHLQTVISDLKSKMGVEEQQVAAQAAANSTEQTQLTSEKGALAAEAAQLQAGAQQLQEEQRQLAAEEQQVAAARQQLASAAPSAAAPPSHATTGASGASHSDGGGDD